MLGGLGGNAAEIRRCDLDIHFFAELNAGAYLAAMQTITRDVQLREEVARRGLQQAAQFSWKRCAQETLQIYQEA